LYTQNIDGLDFQTGIPNEKIVPVHGSLGEIKCESCQSMSTTYETFREQVKLKIKDIYEIDQDAPKESTPIPCPDCGKNGLKPATVLYGSSLPSRYFESVEQDFPDDVDMIIVSGTSFTVSPANFLVTRVEPTCPRIVINNEMVGQPLGIKYGTTRDTFLGGACDEVYLELINQLGWLEDLKKYEDLLSPLGFELLQNVK